MRKLYSILLAVGVLAGAPWAITQAVYGSTASIDANTFSTGSVAITTSPTTALVTFSDMAPGDATTQSLVVANSGTLAMRYAISATATNADAKGLKDQLVLTIRTIDVTTPLAPCDNFDGTSLYTGDLDSADGKLVGDSAAGAQTGDRELTSGSETLCFRVSLPTASGNAFQSAATTGTFTFDAEQVTNNA